MSKFQVKKPEPKAVDIERFAEAADFHSTETPKVISVQRERGEKEEKLTINFTVRLSETDDALLSYVFKNSTEKSKQKLVRKILLEGLEAMRSDMK